MPVGTDAKAIRALSLTLMAAMMLAGCATHARQVRDEKVWLPPPPAAPVAAAPLPPVPTAVAPIPLHKGSVGPRFLAPAPVENLP